MEMENKQTYHFKLEEITKQIEENQTFDTSLAQSNYLNQKLEPLYLRSIS